MLSSEAYTIHSLISLIACAIKQVNALQELI